jgi:hypothetical protein
MLVNISYITYNIGGGDFVAVDKDKNTQILVTFPNNLLEQIDQYWHDKRIMNRNEAIRQLIAAGSKAEVQE